VSDVGARRIVFPLDVSSLDEAIAWVSRLEDRVGLYKVGLELFTAEGPEAVRTVQKRSGRPVFLDLKLHDIPNTVERAARAAAGLGVRMLTVHVGGDPRGVAAAGRGAGPEVSILGVTRLTSEPAEPREVERLAREAQAAGCAGIVCAGTEVARVRATVGAELELVCPGIRSAEAGGDDQVRVVTPARAIEAGADYLVVGRPIREAPDPVAAVEAIAQQVETALRRRSG
jgi:orotidine-5'-phosphate decarboxylase